MKKKNPFLILLIVCLLFLSCEKDILQKRCYKVSYISSYCTDQDAALVSFDQPNTDATEIKNNSDQTVTYQAGIVNVPKEFRIPGKVFYIEYHYASDIDKEFTICDGKKDGIKILIADKTSEKGCTF
nr:hypothetical protein [Pedobacter sp. ASV2]